MTFQVEMDILDLDGSQRRFDWIKENLSGAQWNTAWNTRVQARIVYEFELEEDAVAFSAWIGVRAR